MAHIVSAVFPDEASAERAVTQIRALGIPDQKISIVGRHGDQATAQGEIVEHHADADTTASGTMKGIGIGAGVGALFGLAAAFIPGVGPFIAAGALAETLGVVGGAAAAGAIVGGTAGGIVGALEKYGVSHEDATFYNQEIERGGWFIGVDVEGTNVHADQVRQVLMTAGGRHSAYMA